MKALLIFFIIGFIFNPVFSQNKIISISEDIELIQLEDSIFIHTSYFEAPNYGRFPSNGMLIVKNGKAILIDTPMNEELTKTLFNFINDSMNIKIEKIIIGHYHDDCLGGLEFLHSKGIESISGELTKNKCIEDNLPIPKISFKDSLNFDFEGNEVQCRYFGGGHTFDNIVVWFSNHKILFGGCLIKDLNATHLGNTQNAVVNEWDITVKKIMNEYSDLKYVIPGHGEFGDISLLKHTIELVKRYKVGNNE